MDLNDILKQWEEDCTIGDRLDDVSIQTLKLHAKYLNYYTQAKFLLKREENRQHKLLKNKHLWYNGKLSQQEVDALGWEHDPFDGLKMMQKDLEYFYESDKDIQASEDKVLYYKMMVENIREILEAVKWRHQTVRNIIEVRKFEAGV